MASEMGWSRNKPLHGWAVFLNLPLLFSNATLFGGPPRPSEVSMCLGDLSQTAYDLFKHHTSWLLLHLFICPRKKLLILSKCSRPKVLPAVQCCQRFQLKVKYLLWCAVGISGLMAKPNRAEQCPECRAKVPKESNFPGWIQDKAIDL